MVNILLLRTPSESPPDPYESTLRGASHNPHSISVLETSFTNLPALQDLITAVPQSKDYSGVIVTSKRACEAWTTAVKNELDSSRNDETARSKLKSSLATWVKTPFYVVGKGTATHLGDFRSVCSALGIDHPLDIRGEGSGTGENLAHFILKDLNNNKAHQTQVLLYLTGDKNRDTVAQILTSGQGKGDIRLETMQVYETHGALDFEHNLSSIIQEARKHSQNWCISFFAPSSSAYAYPILRKHFHFKEYKPVATDTERPPDIITEHPVAQVAAIGRVTSSFLETQLNLHVDAVAAQPTPDALLVAISTNPTNMNSSR